MNGKHKEGIYFYWAFTYYYFRTQSNMSDPLIQAIKPSLSVATGCNLKLPRFWNGAREPAGFLRCKRVVGMLWKFDLKGWFWIEIFMLLLEYSHLSYYLASNVKIHQAIQMMDVERKIQVLHMVGKVKRIVSLMISRSLIGIPESALKIGENFWRK